MQLKSVTSRFISCINSDVKLGYNLNARHECTVLSNAFLSNN